jgi:hypothetical protein
MFCVANAVIRLDTRRSHESAHCSNRHLSADNVVGRATFCLVDDCRHIANTTQYVRCGVYINCHIDVWRHSLLSNAACHGALYSDPFVPSSCGLPLEQSDNQCETDFRSPKNRYCNGKKEKAEKRTKHATEAIYSLE